MEQEKRPITQEGIKEAFGDTGDLVIREVEVSGIQLYVYFIDGLTSGGDISDFVIKPLSRDIHCHNSAVLLKKAFQVIVYICVSYAFDDLAAALHK